MIPSIVSTTSEGSQPRSSFRPGARFMESSPGPLRKIIIAGVASLSCLAPSAFAQHAGDIGLQVVDGRLDTYGPIGSGEDTGVHFGVFGDTGFPGYTPNPGFDAVGGTLPSGRIGFNVLAGLRRWSSDLGDWEAPSDCPERLSISFITLETVVDDDPIAGFDLAVQPDGGWHRHLDFELLPGKVGARRPGVYRLDLVLYSTMGLADSEPFTIAFDYLASDSDVEEALASLEPEIPCPADYDGNGLVDGGDFGRLLAAFGTNDPSLDLNGDGFITGADVGIILSLWGPCPE